MNQPNPNVFDPLVAFAIWFLQRPMASLRPPKFGTNFYRGVCSTVLYRQGQYQVELFQVAPNNTDAIPEHAHPNVDEFGILLSGEYGLTIEGEQQAPDEALAALAPDGAALLCGVPVRIPDGAKHRAIVGKAGGSFLSIQHWLNGVQPTSIGIDWDGPEHGENGTSADREQLINSIREMGLDSFGKPLAQAR